MTRPADILPISLPPRGLSRVQSAAFVGVGATLFDEMVKDRRMPPPKRINGKTVWDRVELEEAFVALPSDEDANPWDSEDVA
jgi:predicted DNA-binding transcriptional regulator AlpA